jgi:hypothetical protein
MSPKARLFSWVVLAALALAAWKTMSPPGEEAAREPLDAHTPPIDTTQPIPTLDAAPRENGLAESHPAETLADSSPLNESTLVGTKWEREGFGFEFGEDGKLLIGGRERAQWRVEGSRIRLYRDTTGEEHWLDIVGDKLMWEGREIGRVP